ncbi:MAG TPA: hypothetical protein VG871_20230 [Vicinamibacterales bacterium]|nr:hypothetical protein [Vicinamibacterales bacterium]
MSVEQRADFGDLGGRGLAGLEGLQDEAGGRALEDAVHQIVRDEAAS